MKKEKMLALLIAAMMLLATLAGCATAPVNTATTENASEATDSIPATTEAPTEVPTIVWNGWPYSSDAWADCFNEILTNFNNDTAGSINLVLEGQAYGDTIQNLLTRAASGDGPDVAMVNSGWLPQLNEMGCLVDLTDYISQEAKDDVYPGVLDAYTLDGKLVAFPFFVQPLALFYNKDLLSQAGITELPTTMDELIADAEKVAALGSDDAGNKIYGLGLANSGTETKEGYNILPMIWANGGDITDANGNVVLNSEENIDTFTTIQSLYQNGVSPNGMSTQEMRNLFGTGKLGFYWDLQSQTSTFCQVSELGDAFMDHIGAIPVPEGYGYSESIVMVVFNSCKNVEAAGKVVEYMSGIKTLQAMANNGKTKMSSRASVMDAIFANVTDEITASFVKAASSNRELPCVKYSAFEVASQDMLDALIAVAAGGDVTENLNSLNEKVTELYK